MKEKVVLGMSGGVDSSVAAYLLLEKGYDVIGITMNVMPEHKEFKDAKKVATELGIPHYIVDFSDIFKKRVIDYFIDEYSRGRTPNPCVVCNKYIKFSEFLKKANEIEANYIATGHYAKVEKNEELNRYILKRPVDIKKDQTYFLYNMTQNQLQHTLFPLGEYTKQQIRKIAESIGLDVSNKPDSEEICFIPDNDHGKFIKNRKPENVKPGYFIDSKGNILGKHKGIIYYTIGQRKGLGISLGKRIFVQDIIPEKNLIVLGDEDKIFKKKLFAKHVNIIPYKQINKEMKVKARVRYRAKESLAKIIPSDDGIIVEFESSQRAITKGQSVVFYDKDVVVGGGIISKVF